MGGFVNSFFTHFLYKYEKENRGEIFFRGYDIMKNEGRDEYEKIFC